jgi:hypothetical protein
MKMILTLAFASFLAVLTLAQGQPSANETNPEIAEIFSNAPPPPAGFATPMDYVKSFTREKDILNAYHGGKLSKEEAMLALESLGNKVSMDT